MSTGSPAAGGGGTALRVEDNPALARFEATVGGEPAGFVAYRLNGNTIALTHTEVLPAFEGRGVGGALARSALDDARHRELTVQPSCPFIASWIERHPDYADLVAPGQA
jgi:predicted GNAT family acetyltransferase